MKRFAAPTLIILASFALSLAGGEALLRLIGFSFPSFTMPDEANGSRMRAGLDAWQRGEGVARVTINSQGQRDREHELTKPAGTVRIAVLGDSFTAALEVPMEAAFWAVLGRELAACKAFGGKPVEVINFGIDGHGTAQELLTLRQQVWRYSPDLVLLAFFPGNDVRNNSKTLEPETMRPFFVLREGELVLDRSFAQNPEFQEALRVDAQRAALQNLRVYQLLRRVKAGRLQLRHNTPIAVALAAGGDDNGAQAPLEAGLDENVYREPPTPAWSDAWTITDKLLVAMHQETRQHGARFMVAVLSSAGAVYPDPAWRERYTRKLGVSDLFYPERRLQRLGASNGFEVLALAPQMQREADAKRQFMHGFTNTVLGFGHWNENGHGLAGKLIARKLCSA